MPSENKFFKYIYSSAPLTENDFDSLKHDGIFKNYFADNPFRKPILEKLEKSLAASEGGVFLISGYRGVGKTTFLNYILNNLKKTHFKAQLNLSEIKFDFKLELIGWMIFVVKEGLEKEIKAASRFWVWLLLFVSIAAAILLGVWPFLGKGAKNYIFEYYPSLSIAAQGLIIFCLILNLVIFGVRRRLLKDCRDLFESVFFEREREISGGIDVSKKGIIEGIMKLSYKETIREKENLFLYESRLKDLLKEIKERKIFSKRFVFVLDELDKLPVSSVKAGYKNKSEDNGQEGQKDKNSCGIGLEYQKMEWLLKMLSDIKSFFFESGAVFVLVVNKDVYDCWKHRHSQEDLFMNLVTNVEYLPCYTKEEMELSRDFPITLSEDADIPYPFSAYAVKKYFQATMYYESYGNPRLYFQNLSKNIKNGEIRIGRDEAGYLFTKFKLFELNELIYDYVYLKKERIFDKFIFGVDEIRNVFKRIEQGIDKIEQRIDEIEKRKNNNSDSFCGNRYSRLKEEIFELKNEDIASVFVSYYLSLGEYRHNLREFWRGDVDVAQAEPPLESKPVPENPVYNKFEAFLTILKQQDVQENYPYTNYVIRRLTDFLRIIEEKHFVSIEDILAELNLREFEKADTFGRYFINLLVPLVIVILRNNSILNIRGNYLHYSYDYNSSAHYSSDHYYHEGFEAELNGDFSEAFKNYNKLLKVKPLEKDVHYRKIRLLYYMMKLGYYDEKIDVVSQWFDSLLKMRQCFPEKETPDDLSDDWQKADYLFLARYFLRKMVAGAELVKMQKLLGWNKEPDSQTIERIYSRAVERYPLDANIKMLKGYFLLDEGRYAAALDLFQEARRDYREPFVLNREAYAYSRLGDKQKAKRFYLEAFGFPTSWLQKASIVINLAKLISPDVRIEENNLFWNDLEEFRKVLIEKIGKLTSNEDSPNNYYFIFEALGTLYTKSNESVPSDIDKINRAIASEVRKQGWAISPRGKMIEFYRDKTF